MHKPPTTTVAASLLALFTLPAACAPTSNAEAQKLADPKYGPIPGQSRLFSDYRGKAPPFPGNITAPILPTEKGEPGPDDQVWQNLLAAEWAIFNFYQQGVEAFNALSFVVTGFRNNTYDRIAEIRDNEAGHLRIFQNEISNRSVKPGACKYKYSFTDATSLLALTTFLEVASMAFLTGLVQQPKSEAARGAMVAIATVEARHETWSLANVWGANPFSGPGDTVFPYANEILDLTNTFIVPGSCPKENPPYPYPNQRLPALSAAAGTKSVAPGSEVSFNFTDPANQPKFKDKKSYYAVFFHGVSIISVPVDVSKWRAGSLVNVIIPPEFEVKGVIIAVFADAPGAPKLENVIAGPEILLQQPSESFVQRQTLISGGFPPLCYHNATCPVPFLKVVTP
ncbi:hypothetical protein CPLU01_10438 [Colletotrichum plurivorum]|uniref:Ferritin-like domain-containing protein n=1 Tax=Colletotrichum plurivorum TaxID=2175906 RepID=A0A8H6K622_9PEZI|nr:hypothetical protein CPLU01_10438 [Colletotrichum plurivorum]